MLTKNRLIEIGNIEDLNTRSQLVLEEVQPAIRKQLDGFISRYGVSDPYLNNLHIHTYENSLKTTITDSKNPKYADKKQNYSKKAFVELLDRQYYESTLNIIRIEVDLQTSELLVYMYTDFYPFWAYSIPSRIQDLENVIAALDNQIQIFPWGDSQVFIGANDFIGKVKEYIKNKRYPNLCFGKVLPLDDALLNESLIDTIGSVYQMLNPVRQFIHMEAKLHSNALRFIAPIRNSISPVKISVFSKTYEVIFDKELKKIKTNEYKQDFSIYDGDQLIVTGLFLFLHREPKEVIGVFINKRGCIFSNIREFANKDRHEWYNKKSFYQRGKHNENNENQKYTERSVEELKKHGFKLDSSNAFYVGTYEKENHSFTEPIEVIKQRLITASALFADILGISTFPKGESKDKEEDENQDEDLELEQFKSSFDITTIIEFVEQSGFTFSIDIIRDFYLNLTSLEDKHFVILNGISGTGKTQLCRVFANAVYGLDYSEDHPYLKIIAVHPDWTDSTSLFGYYSSFEKRFMRTEFLDMLLQANEQKDKPHFVVLDEMNLARVEYYLSDYLSAIESRKPIRLHNMDEVKDIPQTIEIPHNFYLIGTINVDETTHSISDKVLDRVFVMTLSDIHIEKYWGSLDTRLKETLTEEWEMLIDIHSKLTNFDLHFGYRTINEILKKLYKNALLPEDIRMEKWVGLDRVISEKVLPKIRGDERIDTLLKQLETSFSNRFEGDSESLKHIVRMRKELERYGATQFWR